MIGKQHVVKSINSSPSTTSMVLSEDLEEDTIKTQTNDIQQNNSEADVYKYQQPPEEYVPNPNPLYGSSCENKPTDYNRSCSSEITSLITASLVVSLASHQVKSLLWKQQLQLNFIVILHIKQLTM